MRLLRLEDDGEFSLTEFVGRNIPRYAILSHTWGADEEEVAFKDIADGAGKSKAGHRKILFCGKQAAKDGLRYFWVDTCCIDKSSSAELSEAINSMFRWYHDAAKCYVYLSDVSMRGTVRSDLPSHQTWTLAFQRSRWFTRGWTLQELLAPMSVEFFSMEGERLGDKELMVQEIHEITKISAQALQGRPLSRFSVGERISWAAMRETKREEDAAYALLGIFNIHMPLIYGEGRENALIRLHKEIRESLSGEWPTLCHVPATRVARMEAVGMLRKYDIPFTLKCVPVGKFADRPQDRVRLERTLLPRNQDRRRRILVVYGLGGVGKTQLAAEFARRHQHSFTSVFWFDGSSEGSLKQSIAACASRIPVGQVAQVSRMFTSSEGGDIDAVVKDVLAWLSIPDNGGWLVVVDNVDRDYRRREEDTEAYAVGEYLPEADHGSVLITTRLPHLGQLGEQWEVKKVDAERSRAIFETWYGREVEQGEAEELLDLLDGLPLALAQAAAYMSETGANFGTYTRLYKEQWRELMEPQDRKHLPLQIYSNGSVATSWMISYTAIRRINEAAANLLLLWAHLDHKSLWHGLLASASRRSGIVAKRTSSWLKKIADDEMEFVKAIGVLRSYSLVEEMQGHTGYATHPVVHQWALHIQDESQRADLSWVAIAVVGLAVPDRNEKKYWETQMRLLAHVEWCKRSIEEATKERFDKHGSDWQQEEEALLRAVHNLGVVYADRGKLDDAEEMYMRALEGREKALGGDHTSTLHTVNNLGLLYKDRGKLAEAEKMYNRALEGYEQALGGDHTSALNTVNNLGALYKDQGKLFKAEKMYMRALEGREKALGGDHVSTLDTIHNLGALYKDQGKLAKAEEMYMRALEGRKKALGGDDVSTLNTVNNLGTLYKDRGKLAQAEMMYDRALKGYEQALGGDHPLALNTVNNLGLLYKDQGKLAEADKMYERALEGYEKALGIDHTSTLNIINNLGLLYKDQGKLAEAEKMYERALEGYEKALGGDHTSALNTVSNLGALYADRGKSDKAEKMYMRALEGYEKALGADHTSTLNIINNLGLLYKDQGKLAEAEKMYNRALEGYEQALGEDHPWTLNTVNNLGALYADCDKPDKAEKMYMRALEGYEKALGADHMSIFNTVNNLGLLNKDQGKVIEAEKMYMRALRGYEKALGTDHIWTLNTVNNLGALYADCGKPGEAEKMYMRALEGYENALGREDIASFIPALNAMWALASLFDCQNREEDARNLYSRALSGYEKVVGGDLRRCQILRDNLAALATKGSKTSIATGITSASAHSRSHTVADSIVRSNPSRWHKFPRIVGRKRI